MTMVVFSGGSPPGIVSSTETVQVLMFRRRLTLVTARVSKLGVEFRELHPVTHLRVWIVRYMAVSIMSSQTVSLFNGLTDFAPDANLA